MVIHTSIKIDTNNAKTRLLLALWDMGALESLVKKGEVMKRIVKSGEKSSDYQPILEILAQQEAIAMVTKNRSAQIQLTELGKQSLSAGLNGDDFKFGGTQVGSRVANALLKWIRQMGDVVSAASGKEVGLRISSYDEFKTVALETYDRINFEFNHNNFVPIYKIRRSIGDLVTRTEFNEWLIKMQSDDILQLQESGVEDSSPDKLQDSVSTPISGLRCYATKKTN
ncbi:hypothetical protein TUMEXPCC7403_24900 [Tumidithrix helvetica PCC 7403]|uniref:hypothetical protein n=1 Tax=Tumidithrix helvetica TaxID=3457545 RepID=UPI003C821BA2